MQETKPLFEKEVEGNEEEAESLPDAKFLASGDTQQNGSMWEELPVHQRRARTGRRWEHILFLIAVPHSSANKSFGKWMGSEIPVILRAFRNKWRKQPKSQPGETNMLMEDCLGTTCPWGLGIFLPKNEKVERSKYEDGQNSWGWEGSYRPVGQANRHGRSARPTLGSWSGKSGSGSPVERTLMVLFSLFSWDSKSIFLLVMGGTETFHWGVQHK